MAEQIKACPFCGGYAVLAIHEYDNDGAREHNVHCGRCDAMIGRWFVDAGAAIAAWNQRPENRSENIKSGRVTKDAVRQVVLTLVAQERNRQLALWGDEAGNNWDRWAVILTEEVGEVCKAIQDEGVDAIRREAVQVAAVACAIVEATVRKGAQG